MLIDTAVVAWRAARRASVGCVATGLLLLPWLPGCSDLHPFPIEETEDPVEPCASYAPLGQAFFGDLHAHTRLSFDAVAYDVRVTPAEAYAFARGAEIDLAPYGADGQATRRATLGRPLDFAALTDHSEFLGEVAHCETPGATGYDTELCAQIRAHDPRAAVTFGVSLAQIQPRRSADLCGADGLGCQAAARERWLDIIAAAEEATDTTDRCEFTALVGYEYTRTPLVTNMHRNVIFASTSVTQLPITTFEQPDPIGLLRALEAECVNAGTGCDAIVIAHNTNLSNGRMFYPDYGDATAPAEEEEIAALRGRMEPLVEVFQHKGADECRNGMDPARPYEAECDFEQARGADDEICPEDEPGKGGMTLGGCVHRLEFARDILLEGMSEQRRLGVNPYRLGFVGSTDTHNGTPGLTDDAGFQGHVGTADDTAVERLGSGNVTHDGLINNPGGLIGVWAPQNRRQDIFDAMRRREVFATSGTRLTVRLFAGWDLPLDSCGRADAVSVAYERGVPMGGILPSGAHAGPPVLFVQAVADLGTSAQPGHRLERVQIIKGWLDEDGRQHSQVVDVAGHREADPGLDPHSCEPVTAGADSLCAVWTDTDYVPSSATFYYARVLEQPSCRWSLRECNVLGAEAPEICAARDVPRIVHERAWSSPIWLDVSR